MIGQFSFGTWNINRAVSAKKQVCQKMTRVLNTIAIGLFAILCLLGCSGSRTDEILANDDDFELCDGLFMEILDYYGSDMRADDMPESPRNVLLVWHSMGIIDNGGFEYLFEGDFEGDPGFKLTLGAFETIGSDAAASAVRDALALFPDGEVQSDLDERIEYYESLPEDKRMELNRRFWYAGMTGSDEIQTKLASFIRAHKADFDW